MAGVFCPRFFRGLGKALGRASAQCLLDFIVLTDTILVFSFFLFIFNMLYVACAFFARVCYAFIVVNLLYGGFLCVSVGLLCRCGWSSSFMLVLVLRWFLV